MLLDLTHYKIRVILKPGDYSPSSKTPLDMEGTVIGINLTNNSIKYYNDGQKIIKLFVEDPMNIKNILVRWDNDIKTLCESYSLRIREHQIPYWTSIWDSEDSIHIIKDVRPFTSLKPQTIPKNRLTDNLFKSDKGDIRVSPEALKAKGSAVKWETIYDMDSVQTIPSVAPLAKPRKQKKRISSMGKAAHAMYLRYSDEDSNIHKEELLDRGKVVVPGWDETNFEENNSIKKLKDMAIDQRPYGFSASDIDKPFVANPKAYPDISTLKIANLNLDYDKIKVREAYVKTAHSDWLKVGSDTKDDCDDDALFDL